MPDLRTQFPLLAVQVRNGDDVWMSGGGPDAEGLLSSMPCHKADNALYRSGSLTRLGAMRLMTWRGHDTLVNTTEHIRKERVPGDPVQ